MLAGPQTEGGSIRAGVLIVVAGLALASGAVHILRQEPTRPHERLVEIVVDEKASLVDLAMDYQQ